MRISAKDTLLGIPILKIRHLVRLGGSSQSDEYASEVLGIEPVQTERVLSELESQGYIERRLGHWSTSNAGLQLANAKATRPLRRETADRLLEQFLARVQQVRDNPEYLYKVTKVVVFGSYITDAEQLGDIDLAIEIKQKATDRDEFDRLCETKVCKAISDGRQFREYRERLWWPYEEVRMFLKNRSAYLSIHSLEDPVLKIAPQKVIYTE